MTLNKSFGSTTDILTDLALLNDNFTALDTPETWIAPTLLNSWANFGGGFSAAGYYKDASGVVRLKGTITGGTATADTVLFTLPVGYRPSESLFVAVVSNNSFGAVHVNTDGSVMVRAGSNVFFCLNGVSFRV